MPNMPMLIDGHNLIPKIPGMHLSDLDDEIRLVEMLQVYARLRRKGVVECYFDKALAGRPRTQMAGTVKVQFARPGKTADAEIEIRLAQLGRQARNWVVVSADQRVRQSARAAGAQDVSSDIFAKELLSVLATRSKRAPHTSQEELTQEEVEMWLEAFRKRPKEKNG